MYTQTHHTCTYTYTNVCMCAHVYTHTHTHTTHTHMNKLPLRDLIHHPPCYKSTILTVSLLSSLTLLQRSPS